MTEDEARKKWCPFVRLADNENRHTWNRSVEQFDADGGKMRAVYTACIASECMAWRWKEILERVADGEPMEPGRVYIAASVKVKVIKGHGFCGLAGKESP